MPQCNTHRLYFDGTSVAYNSLNSLTACDNLECDNLNSDFGTWEPSMSLIDGTVINRTVLDAIYGKSGTMIGSFGVVAYLHQMLYHSCNDYVVPIATTEETLQSCIDSFYKQHKDLDFLKYIT